MKQPFVRQGFLFVSTLLVAFGVSAVASAGNERPWMTKVPAKVHNAKNPFALNMDSIESGERVYKDTCIACHGIGGMGDGPAAEFLTPRPKPLFVNRKVVLGDALVHYVIEHGIPNTAMSSLSDRVSTEDAWHVVNYLHYMIGDRGEVVAKQYRKRPRKKGRVKTPAILLTDDSAERKLKRKPKTKNGWVIVSSDDEDTSDW